MNITTTITGIPAIQYWGGPVCYGCGCGPCQCYRSRCCGCGCWHHACHCYHPAPVQQIVIQPTIIIKPAQNIFDRLGFERKQ